MITSDTRRSVVVGALAAGVFGCASGGTSGASGGPAAEPIATIYTLRASLERLAELEDAFFGRHGHYTMSMVELGYEQQAVVEIRITQDRGPEGYAAVARGGGAECAVFRPPSRPPRYYLIRSGEVACGP